MDRDQWLTEIFEKYPELDNTLGYHSLYDALNHTYDNDDSAIAELAIYYMKQKLKSMGFDKMFKDNLELEYEDSPES